VPLIAANQVIGTGSLFQADGRHFIITAGHLAQDFERYGLRVPSAPRGARILVAGPGTITSWNKHDVAVFEIASPEVAATLKTGWSFLSAGNVWLNVELRGAFFLLFGYPTAQCGQNDSGIRGSPLPLVTSPFLGIPTGLAFDEPYHEKADFFLEHARTTIDLESGVRSELAPLGGMSGCPLWALRRPDGASDAGAQSSGLWVTGEDARIIAIQSGVSPGKWIRCKRWWTVDRVLRKLGVVVQPT